MAITACECGRQRCAIRVDVTSGMSLRTTCLFRQQMNRGIRYRERVHNIGALFCQDFSLPVGTCPKRARRRPFVNLSETTACQTSCFHSLCQEVAHRLIFAFPFFPALGMLNP